jgi:hypothetical protein
LHADRRLGRVDADSQIVERHFDDVAPDLLGIAGVVGHRLGVRKQQELPMRMLKRHAIPQRAGVVTEMKGAGRSISGQDHRTNFPINRHALTPILEPPRLKGF